MRYGSNNRYASRNTNSSMIRWIILGATLIGAIFLIQYFLGNSQPESDPLGITISGSGNIVVTDSEGKKRDIIPGEDMLSSSDIMLSVVSGTALLEKEGMSLWVDKTSDLNYTGWSATGGSFELTKGRIWIEGQKTLFIGLKHIDVEITPESVVLLEQQRIHSVVYVLEGSVNIKASGSDYRLSAGNRIMVSQSDLVNPGMSLAKLSGTIDESIKQNAFFLAHNGQEILAKNSENSDTGTIIRSATGSLGVQSLSGIGGKYITITKPVDGTVIEGPTVNVEGLILSPLIKRVTINDREASFGSNNETFLVKDLALTDDTIDLVYKAYDGNSNVLERGVFTVYSSQKKQTNDKLIPTTFPTSDKDFRIISPAENPYKTTASSVTVSGTVPKGTVAYIVVNNFRLKKFPEFGTNWYYYANMSYGTMQDGFNLYEIKFYGANDTLLYTQLFTIIKEGGNNTLSGE